MTNRLPVLALSALSLASGCTTLAMIGPRRADGTPLFQPRQQQASTVSPAAQNPQAYLNNLDAHLRQRGYAPAGAAVRVNQMPASGVIAYALDVQPGRCYTAIGVGDTGTDLNILLTDPFGRTEAHNVLADTTPHVSFCPQQAGRYIVKLQMNRGRGGYYYLSYVAQQARDAELVAFFGGGASGAGSQTASAASPAPRTATLDPQTQGRYTVQDQALSRESFVRVAEPVGLVLGQREERLFPLNLSASACYAFSTLGGPGTSDTDVFIVDGTGAELASDTRVDVDASVRFCPPSDGSYQLRARLYTGAGPVFIAGWMQPRTLVMNPNGNGNGGNGGNGGGSTQTTPTTTLTATPVIAGPSVQGGGLDEAYTLVDIDMQARGYALQGEAQQASLAAGETRDFAVTVERDKCYAVVALGDSGIRNLDVSILDGNRVLDQESETSGRAIVRVCSDGAGARTVRVAAADGAGAMKFALYQFTHGTRGPFNLSGLTWVRLREVTQVLETERYSPSFDFSIETGRFQGPGRVVTKNLELQAGRRYAIVVVGGNGVSSVKVSLLRDGQVVTENATGSSFPDVRVSPPSAGRYELRFESLRGGGPFAYQVFEQAQ